MNQIGILICNETVGGILVSGKNVLIDKALTGLVSTSVSGNQATITASNDMSMTALLMLN